MAVTLGNWVSRGVSHTIRGMQACSRSMKKSADGNMQGANVNTFGGSSPPVPTKLLNFNAMLKAINPKNQTLVNRAVNAHIRYNELNDLRNVAEDNEDTKAYKKYDRMCEEVFDRYLEYSYMLPKGQQQAIETYISKLL